ncbi:tyrosine-type recombinase/integrase [Alphaproteobacteria bacterium]|nr:tyrosine-type recombinase/integrase [Alphaproteobacteria bacterium]
MKLTDRQIQLTKPPHSGRITLTDGNGLQLRITSSDKRTWPLQYRYQGSMRKYTIGSYPGVSLKNARVRNTELRASIQAGHDPQSAKKLAKSPSSTNVEECFEEYLRDHLKINLKTWPEYERAMRKDVLPFVGKIELEALDKPAIRAVIRRIIERGRMVLANRVLQYISKMLKWAVGVGYINTNPAADIPKPSKERSRERVLTLDEVMSILAACDSLADSQACFVKFLLFSGQRLNEIAMLTSHEIMDDHIAIPRDRNKSGETIITPLLPHLKEILDRCPRWSGPFIFSTTLGEKPLSGFSQIKSLLQNESETTNWTFHDFRRSMATALADAGVDQFAIKCALNHKDSSVTGVYNRSHHIKMKSAALAKWCGLIKQNETPLLLPIRAVK